MSDNLQHAINTACLFFYREFEDVDQIADLVEAGDTIKPVRWRDSSPPLMMGIGYLIAKGHLTYKGGNDYGRNISGFNYYKV